MTMGFNEREARLGLRAAAGNPDQAVQHIMQRREVCRQTGDTFTTFIPFNSLFGKSTETGNILYLFCLYSMWHPIIK